MNMNPKVENLTPFQKGQISNPNGRPKKIFNHAKDYGFSKDDVIDCFKLYIAKTLKELVELQNSEISILEMIVINSLIKDVKDGKIDNLDKILNRAVGTPKAEITNTNFNLDVELDGDGLVSEVETEKLFLMYAKLHDWEIIKK